MSYDIDNLTRAAQKTIQDMCDRGVSRECAILSSMTRYEAHRQDYLRFGFEDSAERVERQLRALRLLQNREPA